MTGAVVVTGAAGWLGRRLVAALAHGLPEVPRLLTDASALRCLVRDDDEARAVRAVSADAECVLGDVRDAASLARLCEGARDGVVFHCAGVIHPRRVREFYAVNADGTRAVLDAARRAGVRRFVHLSSNSPLGCNPTPEHRFDESSPFAPYLHYGRSKWLAEEAVAAAGAASALETVVVRAPWFYGPGQPPRQTRFFRMVKEGRAPLVGRGDNVRSMAYVDNLCLGLGLCATKADAGACFWIADRRAYPMREILDTVAQVLAEDFGIAVRPGRLRLPRVAGALARAADGALQAAGLYQQELHVLGELDRNIACSIAGAERVLGYDPPIALREGMRRSVESLLAEGLVP